MREADKLVSVIIPVYKVEKYLPMCVDSVLNQTYQNLEVILVDDGSPDNCPAICDEYAKKDERIRVIHQKNAGLSMARNAGLDICTGAYITFVDSDDALHVAFVERLLAACEENGAEIAVGDFMKATPAEYLPKIAAPLANKPVRVVDGREANMMLYRSRRVAMVDGALYLYTANQSGLMAKRFTPERMTMLDILDERLAFYRENGETGDLIRFTQNRQFMFAAEYYLHTADNKPFRRKARKKQWALYWPLMRSSYWLRRKLVYTYAMLLPGHFKKLYF